MKISRAISFAVTAWTLLPMAASAQSCSLCAKEVIVDTTSAPCLIEELTQINAESASFLSIDLSQCVELASRNRGVVPSLPKALDSQQPTARFILDAKNAGCLKLELDNLKDQLNPFAIIKLSECP